MKKKLICAMSAFSIATVCMTGCAKNIKPGEIDGYDEGEQYLNIWVHSIEETPEGEAYRDVVERFNKAYNGKYFCNNSYNHSECSNTG